MTKYQHISRREMLHRTAKTGLGFVAGMSLGLTPWAAWGEEPRRGGILTLHIPGDPPNFDLHQNTTFMVNHVVTPCYNQLVQYDPLDPDAIIPDLAERWEVGPDGKSYTFFLRKGVKFHDGSLLTSTDVQYSLDLIRQPPAGVVSPRAGTLSAIDGIETPDAHTVRILLKRPNPSLLAALAIGFTAIYPKHVVEREGDMKRTVVGTGPFKLKQYTRGVSIELERNPDYFLPGRPYLDGITIFIMPDNNTAYAAFRTGRLHMFRTTANLAQRAQGELGDKIVIQKVPAISFDTFVMNARQKPWDDIRVREAASLAIDREAAIKVIGDGEGLVGGYMPPTGPWALPREELLQIPGYGPNKEADRERAKQLLAEAGYPQGFKTTLLTRKAFERLGVFVKDQLARIGIEGTVDVKETAAAFDLVNKRTFDSSPWPFGTAIDDPDSIFGEFYTCQSVRNYSGVCVPEVDALFTQQSQTLDIAERKKLVQEMQRKALPHFGKVILLWHYDFLALWPSVRNYRKHPSLYNNNRMQDVWLAQG